MITIELPWPAKFLSPNEPCHWRKKSRIAKLARVIGHQAAWAAGAHLHKLENVSIGVTFHPKTKNAYDLDNAIARIKHYLDGIADAIKVDDSKWEWEKPIKGQPVKGGKVIVTITGQDK